MATKNSIFKRWNGNSWDIHKFSAYDSDKLGGVLPSGYALASHEHGIDDLQPSPIVQLTVSTTFNLTHANRFIYINSSLARTLTVPTNASVAFPIGTEIHVLRFGTGEVTIAAASGVTLVSENNNKRINNRYQAITLKKLLTDTWVIMGALKA